jgi:hypothetical protein
MCTRFANLGTNIAAQHRDQIAVGQTDYQRTIGIYGLGPTLDD